MVLGFNLRDSLRRKRDIATVVQRNDRIGELIDLINERYVDTISNNRLYKDAITGILKSLDPHTVYIPTDEVEDVNNDLEGSFSGIGVEFLIVHDTIEISAVVEKGPAAKAGVETGDQLTMVNDSLVAGNNITADRIVNLLKGKKNSSVNITVKNPITGLTKQVTITRDDIPLYSVDASLMLDGVTGYIKVNRFSAKTYDEFKEALKKLQDGGAKQLVLDLRDNPGGYLQAATAIADDLLDGEKLIVYTQGLHIPKTEFKGTAGGPFEKGKVAVLVDEGSASASEILAGALQDWDRGVIIGRRTYGKGLVQEQYDMPGGAALRLTIARYYTPSGRCIQRSFAKGRDAYHHDFENRLEAGVLTGYDTGVVDTTAYYTANHRPVYSGGGIMPDVYVPYDTSAYLHSFANMAGSEELNSAIRNYYIRNKQELHYKSITEFSHSFSAGRQVADNYIAMLNNEERKTALRHFSNPSYYHYVELQIKAQLARYLFHDNGYYAVKLKEDNVVNKALDVLNSGKYSKIIGGK
jgi:carboxyl-terminal processing protease